MDCRAVHAPVAIPNVCPFFFAVVGEMARESARASGGWVKRERGNGWIRGQEIRRAEYRAWRGRDGG